MQLYHFSGHVVEGSEFSFGSGGHHKFDDMPNCEDQSIFFCKEDVGTGATVRTRFHEETGI